MATSILLGVVAMLAWAGWDALGVKATRLSTPYMALMVGYVISILVDVFMLWFLYKPRNFNYNQVIKIIPWEIGSHLLGAIAFIAFLYGMKRSPLIVAPITSLYIPVAIMFYFFLGIANFSWKVVIGTSMMAIGIIIVVK